MLKIHAIAIALGSMVLSAHGQGASRLASPSNDQKKQVQQAADKLRQAQSSGQLDKAKETAKGLMNNIPANLTETAKSALQSPEIKAQAAEAARNAAKTLLPEAQRLMNSPAAQAAPADAPPAATATTPAADQPPSGPQPQPLPALNQSPTDAAAQAPARKTMAIIEADNSVFDPNTNILIYTGNVRARHPQFYIECEELIIHLEQGEKEKDEKDNKAGGKPKPAVPDDLISADPKKEEEKPSSVKKAIASGPMVRIEKANDKGDLQRAFCRNAVYEGATGIITMRDNPQVQTGNIMQVATTPDTVMTFDQKGNFTSNRRTRTVILSEEEGSAPSRNKF